MAENTGTNGTTSTQRSAQRSTAAARRKTASTQRSTQAKKAQQTRAARSGATARKRTTTRAKSQATRTQRTAARTTTREAKAAQRETAKGIDRLGNVAERVALTYVGGVLTARDNVVETVNDIRTSYGTRAKAERKLETELRKLERRGATARRSLEREVKRTRTKVERDLRQRRARFEREIRPAAKTATSQRNAVVAQGEYAAAQLNNLAQSVATTSTQVAARVQERIAALV